VLSYIIFIALLVANCYFRCWNCYIRIIATTKRKRNFNMQSSVFGRLGYYRYDCWEV